MATAQFQFDARLSRFLAKEFRGRTFPYTCARAATLKNAIEALGVPHTEVGALSVNGEPATLQRTLRNGDAVEVKLSRRLATCGERRRIHYYAL